MSIKFLIPGYDGTQQTRASYRFRATIPLKGMRPEDGIISSVKQATKDDIVVLAKKSTPKDVYYLKSNNIKCVYDICDNKWRKYVAKGWVERIVKPHNEICQNVDNIITTSQALKELVMKHTGRNAIIIADPVEATRVEPKVRLKSRRYINIFSYGSSKHFQKVYWNKLIQKIFDTDIREFKIHCMLDRTKKFDEMYRDEIASGKLTLHEYDFDKQYQLMKECDIVYLPIVVNSMDNLIDIRVKSPNRILDAIQSGKPVITNEGVDSYLPFRKFADFIGFARSFNYNDNARAFRALINRPKEETNYRITQGQNYIKENHSPEIIGKQWIDLENKVGKLGF